MELYLYLQELFVTAFVALLLSLLIAKFFSIGVTSPPNTDHVKLGQKGDQKVGNLDKVLKVKGTKSKKKRVRFVGVDQIVEKIDGVGGIEGSVGEFGEGFEESVEGRDLVENELGERQMFVEMIESGVGVDDVGREESGEMVSVLEELGVGERCERSEMERGSVESVLGGSVFTERDESEVEVDEKIMRLFRDDADVICDQSKLLEMVVEERSEGNANERNLVNLDLNEVTNVKNIKEAVDDEKYLGLVSNDVITSRTGEFEVSKESVDEGRNEDKLNGGDAMSAALDDTTAVEEAENERKVGLDSHDAVGDHSREVSVLKDSVAADTNMSNTKDDNVVNSAFDKVVVNETIENEMADDERRLIPESGVVDGDCSGDVCVVEERENQGTGVEEEMYKGNKEGEGLMNDEDDDWEGIEKSDLEKVFAVAASYVESGGKDGNLLNMGNDVQMQLYGLHKVAMEGPCHEAQPMALKISARAKWNAWQRLGNMSPEVAMDQYVSLLSDKDPGWMEGQISVVGKAESPDYPSRGVPETIEQQTRCMSSFLFKGFYLSGFSSYKRQQVPI